MSKVTKRKTKRRKVRRATTNKTMRALLLKFPVKQDPAMLPPARRELWDAVVEGVPLVRRRA